MVGLGHSFADLIGRTLNGLNPRVGVQTRRLQTDKIGTAENELTCLNADVRRVFIAKLQLAQPVRVRCRRIQGYPCGLSDAPQEFSQVIGKPKRIGWHNLSRNVDVLGIVGNQVQLRQARGREFLHVAAGLFLIKPRVLYGVGVFERQRLGLSKGQAHRRLGRSGCGRQNAPSSEESDNGLHEMEGKSCSSLASR